MDYLGNVETRTTQFQVAGPPVSQLSVSIGSNVTTINENGWIRFTPLVSGNISAVSYNWDFENDSVINVTATPGTGTNVQVFTYPGPNNYTCSVNVTDACPDGTQSQTRTLAITVNAVP